MTRSTGTAEPRGSRRAASGEPPPNHLHELRRKRGWTQQEVADRVNRHSRDPQNGVTADTVSKWERGCRGVCARNRRFLAAAFGVTVDDLGLPGLARGQSETQPDGSLVGIVDQAAELLDQLGDAGHAVRPQVLAALTDEVMSRRAMLSFIDTPEPAPTPPSPDELDALTGHYEALHATAAPSPLLTALTAHLRMIAAALDPRPVHRHTPATPAQPRPSLRARRSAVGRPRRHDGRPRPLRPGRRRRLRTRRPPGRRHRPRLRRATRPQPKGNPPPPAGTSTPPAASTSPTPASSPGSPTSPPT